MVLHGAGSAKESHHDFARAALALGLATVCFDARGHGESDGPMDARAVDDVVRMASLLRDRLGDERAPVALRGSSMGGYLSIISAESAQARAVVAICPASAAGLRRGLAAGRFSFAADHEALDAFLAGHELEPAVAALQAPLLLLHAEGDEQVPIEQSRELARLLTTPASRLIAVPGGHHRSIQHDAELQAVSLRFIEQALGLRGTPGGPLSLAQTPPAQNRASGVRRSIRPVSTLEPVSDVQPIGTRPRPRRDPPIVSRVRRRMDGAVAIDVARECAKNALMGVPAIRERRLSKPRAGVRFDPGKLERYSYLGVRGLERTVGSVEGKSIVEFGPGDTLSAGLALLAAGASRYVTLDRFVPDYSSAAAKQWYRGVCSGWRDAFPDRVWPTDLDPAAFPEAYPESVSYIGAGVETAKTGETFDIVTSWQVGEHVNDIGAFAALTERLMKPDGVAVHRVDFGPHDCWRDSYDDPWLFLRFPDPVWRAMGSNRGYPNRRRFHEFVEAWDAAGLKIDCLETERFDMSRTQRLPRRYRDMSLDSLKIRGTLFVCRRR